MRWTDEASQALERALPPVEGPDARREMRSHLHEAAVRQALSRGAGEVDAEDVDAALADAGGPAGLARAFESVRAPRAGILRRAGAHVLDLLVVHGAILLAWTLAWIVAVLVATSYGGDVGWARPDPFQFLDVDDVRWAGVPQESIVRGLGLGLLLVGVPFAYFVVGDLRGRTPGKRALGLRAVRAEGGRIGLGGALLRSALKASILLAPLLLLDGLAAAGARGQRLTDRMAGARVVLDAASA